MFNNNIRAQTPSYSISPNPMCYTVGATYNSFAGIVANVPGADSYSWQVIGPPGCTPTFTILPGLGLPTNTLIAISTTCCGQYSVTVIALLGGVPIATLTSANPLFSGGLTNGLIYCAGGGASITVATPTICRGAGTALTAQGANTYTWTGPSGPLGSGGVMVVTPTVNSTYTVTGTTAQGCIVTATANVYVQAATVAVSPASQTMCLGSTVCFTATAGAVGGPNVVPSVTTAIEWYDPNSAPPNSFASNVLTTCTNAIGGNFKAILTYTGSAGITCTAEAIAAVTIGTNISVGISASAQSVCPGSPVTFTANSIATNYTWTPGDGSGNQFVNPATFNPTNPTCYTVTADYAGCPGEATVCVGMLTLTPTMAGSTPSTCPGQTYTLSATGGTTYSFYYVNNGVPQLIPPGNSSNSSIVVIPPSLAATYSVGAFGGGCSGGTTFTVQRQYLNPILSPSAFSVCPGTVMTFSATNVGAGSTYTFEAPYQVTPGSSYISTGSASVVAHVPTLPFPRTYTLYADSAGCTGNTSVTIYSLVLNPTLTASSASICPNTQFTLSSSGGAGTTYTFNAGYQVSPGSSVIPQSPGDNTINVVYHTPSPTVNLSAAFYTVTVDSAGCRGTGTIQIGRLNLSNNLSLRLTAPTQSVCPNTMFTFSASGGAGTNYTITSPTAPSGTIPLQTANTATHTQASFPQTYTVSADSAGCTGTATSTVFLLNLNPTITANPNPVCANIPVVLSATGGTNTYFTFVKTTTVAPFIAPVGTPSTTSSTATDSPGPVDPLNYIVYADSAGCVGTATVAVTISPPLVIGASVSSPTTCSGTSATLSATGPTNALYTWFEPSGSGSVAISSPLPYNTATSGIGVNPTVTTSYTVLAVDPAGCEGTAVVTLSINPTASLTIVLAPQNATICPGTNATLTASGTNSYTWSPGGSLQPNPFTPTVIASPSVTTIYTVLGTNNAGCYGVATITLNVGTYPNLQPNIVTTASAVCPGFTSTLTAFTANTYTWTGTTFTNSIFQQSIAVGPGTFVVVGSNGGTCIDSATVVIGQAPPLNINVVHATTPGTTCISSNTPKFSKPVILTASGAASYVWFPYNPNNMTYSLGPQTTVRPPASTCYTVTGFTSICAGTAAICVTVIPQFTMNVTPPLPAMCFGDSLKLSITNVSTMAVGPTSAFTYSWTEAANAPPISISNILTQTVMVYPQNTTTYSVEVFDARKCVSVPRLVTVTVFPRPLTAVSVPTINSVPVNTVCFVGPNPGPSDVVLNLSANNQNQNLPFGVVPTYTWISPYPANYNSILTPVNNNNIVVNAPLRAPAVVVYTVISGYNGIPGCRREDTVSVRVMDCRPVRDVKFTTAEPIDTICTKDCITFMNLTDTMAGNPQSLVWSFPGGSPNTSTVSLPTVCYNLPGKYNVILRVANPYPLLDGGSELTKGELSFIRVVDVPNITIVPPGQISSDTTIRFGTSLNLSASGGITYQWEPNYNITALTGKNVTVKPFRTTQYILTGYNSKSCASRDTLNVIVIEDCGEMFVPNAFSPNGDGHNDVLKVNGICLETLTFMVFNRWGEKIFETNDQANGWDGTYKGDEMGTGVYVYRLEGKGYDGKAFSSKGNITLIR